MTSMLLLISWKQPSRGNDFVHCLFNEIVILMEVRLNKMETRVSVCHPNEHFYRYVDKYNTQQTFEVILLGFCGAREGDD